MPFFRCNQVMHPHKRSCLSVGLFLSLFFFLFLFSFLLSRTERALSKVYDTDRGRCGRKVECTDPLRHILWRTIEARVRCFISKKVFQTSICTSVCLYVHYLTWLSINLFVCSSVQNCRTDVRAHASKITVNEITISLDAPYVFVFVFVILPHFCRVSESVHQRIWSRPQSHRRSPWSASLHNQHFFDDLEEHHSR